MRTLLSLAFTLVLLLAGCAAPRPDIGPSDEALASQLTGSWHEFRQSESKCESHDQTLEFRKDGTLKVVGIGRICGQWAPIPFEWHCTWQVKHGKLLYKSTFSQPATMFPVGDETEDEILELSSQEWVMREGSTSAISRAKKVQ